MHGFPLRLPASIVIRCWYSTPVSVEAFARQVKNAEIAPRRFCVRVFTRSLDVSSVLILATWVRLAVTFRISRAPRVRVPCRRRSNPAEESGAVQAIRLMRSARSAKSSVFTGPSSIRLSAVLTLRLTPATTQSVPRLFGASRVGRATVLVGGQAPLARRELRREGGLVLRVDGSVERAEVFLDFLVQGVQFFLHHGAVGVVSELRAVPNALGGGAAAPPRGSRLLDRTPAVQTAMPPSKASSVRRG